MTDDGLTQSERDFLADHHIPIHTLMDGAGRKPREYRDEMRALGKSFVYGVTPCRAGGHRIRTRAGHCIQCNSAVISYQLRHDREAYIYLATSESLKALKVGQAADVADREGTLQRIRYGGVTDWKMVRAEQAKPAGRVEFAVHSGLEPYRFEVPYFQGERQMWCRELFRCSVEVATAELERALGAQ